MDAALFACFAPGGDELEKPHWAIGAAAVGPFSRQVVEQDGEIVEAGHVVWHAAIL
jgi:hypothetical protein